MLAIADPAAAQTPVDSTLTGDWGGTRPTLDQPGFALSGTYIGETFGNLVGGLTRGAVYEDRFEFDFDANLQKLAGWPGASAHASMYEINGRGPSAVLVGNLLTLSFIEALPSTRLFTLWLQQDLFGGLLSIRLGQIAMDDEFFISTTSTRLVNSTFGNPGINALDMIAGGPAYPIAAPGVRLRLQLRSDLALLAAVFSGNPGGDNCTLGIEICDPSGTSFGLAGGALWVGELQYSTDLGNRRPGSYKIGGWYETGSFADQQFGLDLGGGIVSLAAPLAAGPLDHAGNFGLFAVADQMLWPSGGDGWGLAGFFRIGAAPANRNLVSFYTDAGLSLKGPFPGRGGDSATIGFAFAGNSPAAQSADRQFAAINPILPIADHEAVIEATYIAQLRPWWTVQPDLQYVIHPGGNIPNPANPAPALKNAFVIGLRTTVTF